ncbi:unnamed protein product [Prunus brigantina]
MTQDETRPPAPSANLCASDTMPGMGSNTWIIDTGASDHMTYDNNMFDELSRNPRDPYITSANGLPSPVTGEGTIHLTPSLPLSHALLVPNIRCNLLSVGRLLDTLNASATFYSTHCFFQDLKTHATIGHGKRMGGLYYLQLPAAAVRGCVANKVQGGSVKDKQQLWLWHRRLGHPSFGYLKHLFPSLFSSCDESSFKCETCVMAKSHRTVFPLSNNKAALPFELVHSDNKHDVASLLPEFCAMVSTQFHASVKVFRTDNGGEYVNHTLTQFFRDHGIIHQTTTPFTPQQNGVSERKNRQLLEVARSLLLDMSVPHHLWGHGVLAAAYLINRTPSRVLDFKTPLDVLCAHTPPISVSKLPPKVFGCVAYVHVYSHQRSKLDPCALRCVFIGYSTTQKGYKCYHPPSQKVHVTLDVTFHEEVPYYVSSSSPIQGERGSELKNFGMENLGCTEAPEGVSDGGPPICEKPTGRVEGDDRSSGIMRDDHPICAKPTGRPEGNDRSFDITRDDPPICAKPTGRPEGNDRSFVEVLDEICPSPEECNSDVGDSGEDEIDIRPPSALPLSQSTRDDDEVLSNDVSTYLLPPRTTRGKPKVQYSPEIHAKSKYPINHYVSTHRLSKSYASYLCQLSSVHVPTKLQDALSNPKWVDAMQVEMEALNKNATWELVPLPKGKKAVGCRWVFTLKHKADGSIDRYKARLVAKGYTQTYGVDYTETFAPVAKLNTVRVLLSLAANHDWPLLQFDVKNAFLHGDLKEEIYMDPPPGIPVTSKEGMVCKLRESLYGLKQSPRAWFGRFAASMRKSGYVQSNSDHTLFRSVER